MQVLFCNVRKSLIVLFLLVLEIQFLCGAPKSSSVNTKIEEPVSFNLSLEDAKVSGTEEIVFDYDSKYYSYKNDSVFICFQVSGSSNFSKFTLNTNLNKENVISEVEKTGLSKNFYSYNIDVSENNSNLSVTLKFENPVNNGVNSEIEISDLTVLLNPTSNESRLNFIYDMAIGWNLGNSFDAWSNGRSSETAWGNPPATQKLFDNVAASGFKVVRIPVTWLGHTGSAPDYKIDKKWMKRVSEVAGYAHNAGLKAIINIHHDGADSSNWLNIKEGAVNAAKNEKIEDRLAKMWKQIATEFEGTADWLIFETMNEIHDGRWGWGDNRSDGGKQYRTLNRWNQICVDAIRSAGAANYISVPGYVTNPELTMANLVVPTDKLNRIAVTVHNYDPNDFTLEASVHEWGKNGKKVSSWGQESHLESLFSRLNKKYIEAGVPVIIGECGAVYQSGYENFRNYYMEFFVKNAHKYKLVPVIWDNGSKASGKECSGLFNRSSGELLPHTKDLVKTIVEAVE